MGPGASEIDMLEACSDWALLDNPFLIETVSPNGTFCDTIQVPSGAGDMQLI